jgi:uncharacterized membrane protein HdeD (DUF308 family)
MIIPLNPADSVAILLFIFGILLLYNGIGQSHTGYIVLGIIEVILGTIQMYLNRTDIVFN